MDRRTTGRRRMQPERFGVVPHDGSEEDEEDHANNPPEERSALGRTLKYSCAIHDEARARR